MEDYIQKGNLMQLDNICVWKVKYHVLSKTRLGPSPHSEKTVRQERPSYVVIWELVTEWQMGKLRNQLCLTGAERGKTH
jgi:hypothetical protein